ncbi:MAG: endopeptidase [Solirubrobacteraceae bacterium]|jgi:STE24 endopeptidase|nr:endopeptidase [Solirubrobacteraceae bacterium]
MAVPGSRWNVPLAVVAALAVAQAGVFLLRPRDGVIDPAPVDPRAHFSRAELERARDFRGPQRLIGLGTLAVEGALLVWLVARPPRALTRRRRRPVLAAAAAGAVLSVGLGAAAVPLQAVAHQRAADVGLSTQGWVDWTGDLAKSWAIGAVFAGAGAGAGIALIRRFPRGWWLPASGVVVAFGVATTYLGPVVLEPIFNRFTPLPEGRTRADVIELARRAGVDVGEVYEVDASRRTSGANAYVSGLGRTKRVVLYDTLLKRFERDEIRLVVAHELGHVRYRDVPHGLLYLALVAPAGMFAAAVMTRRLAPPDAGAGPAVLPALALAVLVLSTSITIVSNQLSRRVEARADTYALELTRAPDAFIAFERRITVQNVSDPDPPRWAQVLFGTHPTTVERIGAAVAFRTSGLRAAGPADRRTPGGS